jgi:hypothetical protein
MCNVLKNTCDGVTCNELPHSVQHAEWSLYEHAAKHVARGTWHVARVCHRTT